MTLTFWAMHVFGDLLRLVGLRDRLRCPRCRAVGTWKPHGGWLDFADTRKVRRWLCKWCGLYWGPEGVGDAHLGQSAWALDGDPLDPSGDTPQRRCDGLNPWKG